MAIFMKRPLAAGCLALILCVILAYLVPIAALVVFFLSVLAILFLLILIRQKKLTYQRIYLLLLCIGILLGSGRALLETGLVNRSLEERAGEEVAAEFSVVEVRYTNSYSSLLIVSLRSIEGMGAAGNAVLISDTAAYFHEGDVISGNFAVSMLDETEITYPATYRAEGCVIALSPVGEEPPALVKSGSGGFRFAMKQVQLFFSDIIKTYVDGEEGNLLSAMLLGEREELSDLTERNFRRSGVSHLLALSGLHLGILAGIADRFFCGIGVGKKPRMMIVMGLMLLYLVITGFSYSMLRAVLMLGSVYLAFCLEENGDAMTALFTTGALIILITPYAIFSVSYQMTMLATFGILSFSDVHRSVLALFPQKHGIARLLFKPLKILLSSLLITVSASVAVLPVQWLSFGEFSLATPLSNLLLVPLAAPLLVLGLMILFMVPPTLWGFFGKKLAGLLLFATERIANTDCVISLTYDFVPFVLIPFFAIMLLLLFVDLKKLTGLSLVPVLLCVVAFFICFVIHQQANSDRLLAVYRPDGKNEGIVLYNAKGALMIDISAGSVSQLQQNWQLLQEEGATELDILVLTHYHQAQISAVSRFGKRVLIREIFVPAPTTESDEAVLAGLRAAAEELHISLTVYPRDTALRIFGEGSMMLSTPLYEKRSTQPAFRMFLSFGSSELWYESAAFSEFSQNAGGLPTEVKAELFILGIHGPVPHEKIQLECAEAFSSTVLIPGEDIAALVSPYNGISFVSVDAPYRFMFLPD